MSDNPTKSSSSEAKPDPESSEKPKKNGWIKVVAFLIIVAIAGVLYWQFGDQLSLKALAKQETALREYQEANPVLVLGLAFLAYVTVTGLSLPGAAPLTLLYGWYFGFIKGVILVSFASTLGATIAFLISRYLFRDAIQSRFGKQLEKFNESLEKEGPFYLFTLRLIPAVPFFVINAVMGLTKVKTLTFWWVSQLGMLAGTLVFVFAGSSVPNLTELADKGAGAAFTKTQIIQIFVAFAFIGILPLAARWAIKLWKGNDPEPAT